jgi:hypothetical protein
MCAFASTWGRKSFLNIDLNGIVIIVGNYGSGKSEVAVNLSVDQKLNGQDIKLADLDLVNPYFRSREARNQLREFGIRLILPHEKYMAADLPILVPEVAGAIRDQSALIILDAGGDDVGATVLAALAESFKNRQTRMLQVVNPMRPFTETIDGCEKIRREIEAASKLEINGIIGNANLIEETRLAHIYAGYDFVREYSRKSGLRLEFITAPQQLEAEIDFERFDCPVLLIRRQLVPPWKPAARLAP